MKLKTYAPFLPLFIFILWESGAIHTCFGLITPLYIVSLASAISLFAFTRLTDVSRFKIPLALLLFSLPIFALTSTPYVFIVLVLAYFFLKSTILFKGSLILAPLSITEGFGLAFPLPLTIFFTFLLLFLALELKEIPKREVKPITFVVICVSLILLLVSFSPLDPFSPQKNNIVAYDAYHHKIESLFFKNDTMTYSTLRFLRSIGYKPLILDTPIVADTLKEISVLIIETPEKNFTLEEMGNIVKFVEAGGGLFVLGDHTNIYNCYITLNPLLNRFGIRLNFDYSMLWEPHFSSLAGLNSVEETAGATLDIGAWDGAIFYALKHTTWADLGDWQASHHAYIGNLIPEEGENYGVLPICVATNYYRGRIVAIANSDSTSGANLLYNYNFVARIIDYLNHENSIIRSIEFRLVLVLLIVISTIQVRLSILKLFLVSLLVSLVLLQTFAILPINSMPKENKVALDVGHGNIEGYGPPHLYKNIFFVIFAQHYGFNPILVRNIPENIGDYKAYVTMGPTVSFSEAEVAKIRNYVEKGGVLIVFDGYHAETLKMPSNDASNSLLKAFNISLGGQMLGEISYFRNTTWNYEPAYWKESRIKADPLNNELMRNVNASITMSGAVEINGGTPIATYSDKPVIVTKNVVKGYVLVVGDHTIFRRFVEYEPIFRYPDIELKKFIENVLVFIGGAEQIGV